MPELPHSHMIYFHIYPIPIPPGNPFPGGKKQLEDRLGNDTALRFNWDYLSCVRILIIAGISAESLGEKSFHWQS